MNSMTNPNNIPDPKRQAIIGMYLNISRRTPLRDVNVVAPVKNKARKATAGTQISMFITTSPICRQRTMFGFCENTFSRAKGKVTAPPNTNPLVLKSGVGIQGSKIGNKIIPDTRIMTRPGSLMN